MAYTIKLENLTSEGLNADSANSIKKDGKELGKAQIISLSYDKRVYEPCTIKFTLQITGISSTADLNIIADSLVGTKCSLTSLYSSNSFLAENYLVFSAKGFIDIVKTENNTTSNQYYVDVTANSADKLTDIVEECRAFTGKKLFDNILKDSLSRYNSGTKAEANIDTKNLQFLSYAASTTDNNGNTTENSYEFIQPYVVQYNETFYRMLIRTANRCGEFVFFENGKLNVGLKYTESVPKNNYVPLSVKYPSVSVKSIFANRKLASSDYSTSASSSTTTSSSVGSSIKNLKAALDIFDTSVFKDNENKKTAFENIVKDVKELETEYKNYQNTLIEIQQYELAKKKKTDEETKQSNINSKINELDPDGSHTYTTAGVTKPTTLDQANDYIVKTKEARDKYKRDNYWTPERAERYNELKAKETRDFDEEDELSSLQDLLDNKEKVNQTLDSYEKDIQLLDMYILKFKQDALVDDLTKVINDTNARKWRDNQYNDIESLKKAWEAYFKDKKDGIKTEYDKIKSDLSEELQALFDSLLGLDQNATPDAPDNKDNAPKYDIAWSSSSLMQSTTQFIYDYDASEDEYFTVYAKDQYNNPKNLGLKPDIHLLQGLYKLLADSSPVLACIVKLGIFYASLSIDLVTKINMSNSMMNSQWKDVKASGATDDVEYKFEKEYFYDAKKKESKGKFSTNMLFTSVVKPELMIQSLKSAGLKAIRMLEEKMEGMKICMSLDTASSQEQLMLGDKILFEENEYIVTAMRGQYNGKDAAVPFTEEIEAIPVVKAADTSYCIPPMIAAGHVRYAEAQTAKVKNNMDPADMGRVRVRFGWQTNGDDDTPLIRVAAPWAPPGGGFYCRPGIDEEVMVDFEHGNVERPYVTGSLFNKDAHAPLGGDKWAPQTRVIESANGHKIVFSDLSNNAYWAGALFNNPLIANALGEGFTPDDNGKDSAGSVLITDRIGLYKIEASSDKRSIVAESPMGTIKIDAFSGIDIIAPFGDLSFYGKNVTIKARNKINIASGLSLINNTVTGNLQDLQDVGSFLVNSIIDLSIIRHVIERFIEPIGANISISSTRDIKEDHGIKDVKKWGDWIKEYGKGIINLDDSIWSNSKDKDIANTNWLYREIADRMNKKPKNILIKKDSNEDNESDKEEPKIPLVGDKIEQTKKILNLLNSDSLNKNDKPDEVKSNENEDLNTNININIDINNEEPLIPLDPSEKKN